jgi:hypothetical protein
VADQFRAKPLCGVHALPAPPRRWQALTCEARADTILPPSLAIPFPPCSSLPSEAATGGEPAAATKKSTMPEHHRLIPRSHSRTLSSSTSPTSPCNPIDSGRAHRACGSTAVAIVAAKPSSHVVMLLWVLPPLLSGALCPP